MGILRSGFSAKEYKMIEDLNPRTIEALSDAIATDIGGAIGGAIGKSRHSVCTASAGNVASLFAVRANRTQLMIQNTTTDAIYVVAYDPDNGATGTYAWVEANGIKVEAGYTFVLENESSEWIVAMVAGGAVRGMEVYP